MKVLLSGAQGVGKTTLTNILRPQFNIVFDEVVRGLAKRGFKVNEAGNDETQLAVMEAHLENLKAQADLILYDRGVLDCASYSLDLSKQSKITPETLGKIMDSLESNISKYDYIFYIKPEFEIEDDGFRDTSKAYQKRIVECFDSIIKKYNIPVVRLSGSIDTRIKKIKDTLNSIKF